MSAKVINAREIVEAELRRYSYLVGEECLDAIDKALTAYIITEKVTSFNDGIKDGFRQGFSDY